MTLLDTIRSAGGGKFVAALASQAGIEPAEAEEAMRAKLRRSATSSDAPRRARRGPRSVV